MADRPGPNSTPKRFTVFPTEPPATIDDLSRELTELRDEMRAGLLALQHQQGEHAKLTRELLREVRAWRKKVTP